MTRTRKEQADHADIRRYQARLARPWALTQADLRVETPVPKGDPIARLRRFR